MSRYFLLLTVFLFTIILNSGVYAQNFSYTPLGSSSIHLPYIQDSIQVIKLQAIVRNNSASNINFRFARITNDLPAGWETQMCYDLCYAPFIDTISMPSDPPYTISPNHADTNFYIDFTCTGQGTGNALVKMFNTDDPSQFETITFNVQIGNVGIQTISSNAESYNLFQNYPNPFNPSTNINFSISKPDFVTLKVYDILGNEVAVLIDNEKMNSGNYKASFNGNNLTSGIYFYTIHTNYFSSTKKMTLLK